jgi:arabinofuranosyltransferase
MDDQARPLNQVSDGAVKSSPRDRLRSVVVLMGLSALLAGLGLRLSFTQDDAFILFRYAANLLAGHGLVFNPGEWVEGYTCPLWLLMLAGCKIVWIDFLAASRLLGLVFGVGTLWVVYGLGKTVMRDEGSWWLVVIAPALLALNPSFASFATSGLDTALFTFLFTTTIWGFVVSYRKNRFPVWLALALVLLTLTRPEGILVFAIIWLCWVIRPNGGIRLPRLLLPAVTYAVPMAAITAWRWITYGYALPNPAYAKVFFDSQSLVQGLDYTWAFLSAYGWFGGVVVLVALPVVIRSGNRIVWRFLAALLVVFTLYIIAIGGDVLKGLRFFVPLLPIYYLLVQGGVGILRKWWFQGKAWRLAPGMAAIVILVLLVGQGLQYPRELDRVRLENGLTDKMSALGKWFVAHQPAETSIAANSIGALGYYTGYKIVDMVGLVDETIAHHPQIMEGIQSPAKERTYHAAHVLGQCPDFIVFDTYEKPNHAGDFALYLHGRFRDRYYRYPIWMPGREREMMVFKVRDMAQDDYASTEDEVWESVDFVYALRNGLDRVKDDPLTAKKYFTQCVELGPPDFVQPKEWLGMIALQDGDRRQAEEWFRQAVEVDSFSVTSVRYLAKICYNDGKLDAALRWGRQLVRMAPHIPDGWLMVGWILQAWGEPEAAKGIWRQGLAVLGPHREMLELIRE